MATTDGVKPERPEEPWWSQAAAAGAGQPVAKSPKDGSTVAPTGGTLAPPNGVLGMPTEFGRYRVRKQLGGGGMGAVYLVENTELKRDEALKVPHLGIGDDPEVRERFLREARAAAQLDHPNLCPVYDVGAIDGVCFLTMRYLKGKLLSEFTGKAQPPRKAVEITAKLAQALESAHAKGVIHRDLKPNNVMMCAGIGPVVMDFGLAKQTKSEDHKLTQSGTTMGTPSYMPPEQIKGELDRIGPASDVYSLGVILFEMLTGRLPFKGATVGEVYGLVLHTEAPPPSSLRPELNPALDAICAKALAKTPEGRYPSMKVFAAALIDFLKAAPSAEGAGNLTPTKSAPADIFQAATVAPNRAAHSTPGLQREPTQGGNKAPASIRQPVSTQLAQPQVTVSGADEKPGRSVRVVLGLAALLMFMLSALGGVGYLVYAMSQKKAVPASDVVVAAQPTTLSENGKTSHVSKGELPKVIVPTEDVRITEPRRIKHSKADPPRPAMPAHPRPGPHTIVRPRPVHPKAAAAKVEPPLKIEPPTPAAPKPEKPNETVIFHEDFSGLEVGARPKGWKAQDFSVETENERRCLEATKQPKQPNELFAVELPKLEIKGDFAVDCELRLCGNVRRGSLFGRPNTAGDQRFQLLLLGNRNSKPVRVVVDYLGRVTMGAAQMKETPGFRALEPIRFRLTRKGDIDEVSINGDVIVGQTIPRQGAFQTVRIGLTGGKPSYLGAFPACLYSIKITSLEPPHAQPEVVVIRPAPASIKIDFRKVAVGTLPEGWKANKANLAVRKTGESAALELVNPALESDMVTLPKVELKGGFYAEVAAVLVEKDTVVQVFFKGAKTKTLVLGLAYRGAVSMPGQADVDGSSSWIEGKPNILRVERVGNDKGYVVKLNGDEVGAVRLAAAPGPFTKVELTFIIKDAKKTSPRVTSVVIVPLEEAP